MKKIKKHARLKKRISGNTLKNEKAEIKTVSLSHSVYGVLSATADKILLAASDHHKIKALVIRGKEAHWFERTCSLDELISSLQNKHFKRITKFYALNRLHCFSYSDKEGRIYFKNGYSALLEHPFKLSVFLTFMQSV